MSPFPAATIRSQFPFFHGKKRTYLDSAATCQTPECVLDALREYYTRLGGNVHRGLHEEMESSTQAYEGARASVADFIHADAEEVIFTKNATESINLAANAWAQSTLKEGDSIVLSILEHHSNMIPWHMLKEERGIEILWVDCDTQGNLDYEQYKKYLTSGNVKLVSVTGQSNVLGVRPNCALMAKLAHEAGAKVLVDASQLVVHHRVDVREIGCDFLAFSGHKLYGPTGVGVLFASKDAQKEMTPRTGGGGMVKDVTRYTYILADAPHCFEAGTPPIAQAIGLQAAIDWLSTLNEKDREGYEEELIAHAKSILQADARIHVLGERQSGCLSFVVDGAHPHDISDILSERGVAVRAGHHCAKPLHDHLGIPASTRLSVALYNTKEDIDTFGKALHEALNILLPTVNN